MIQNIFRIIVVGAIIVGVSWGFAWLLQTGSEIPLTAFGKEYRPSLLGIVLLALGVLSLFYVFIKLIEFLVALSYYVTGDKNAITQFFDKRGHKRGIQALRDNVIATATGNNKAALKSAYRADRYLDEPALTGLLIADAAKKNGKATEVETAYKRVLKTQEGRHAAIRGLLEGRVAAGDTKTAIGLAKEALTLDPKDVATTSTLYDLQVGAADFEGARETLKAKIRLEKLPTPVAKRREAVLSLAEAQTVDRAEDPNKYRMLADRAFALAPNLIPAALASAEAAVRAGDPVSAANTLGKAWAMNPHPQIATAYGQLVADEAPQDRVKRFASLLKRNKGHIETKLLAAELNLAAEDFPAAKRALGEIADNPKTARQYAIVAAIEHGMGAGEEVVRAYLAQSSRAPRGPEWFCESCSAVHNEWAAVCTNCSAFDRIEWGEPSTSGEGNTQPTPEYLLPLVTRNDLAVAEKK